MGERVLNKADAEIRVMDAEERGEGTEKGKS